MSICKIALLKICFLQKYFFKIAPSKKYIFNFFFEINLFKKYFFKIAPLNLPPQKNSFSKIKFSNLLSQNSFHKKHSDSYSSSEEWKNHLNYHDYAKPV